MDPFLRPLRNLPPGARRWSLVLVLLCGALLGFFIFRAFASPLYRQYRLDFGAAQWIEPAEFAPVAYFRREIFLNAEPEQAWLEAAATDSFKIINNNNTVGTETNLKMRVAQIYDVKRFLKPGTNVIAISVVRNSYQVPRSFLSVAALKNLAETPAHLFQTNSGELLQGPASYRVQRNGSLPWCRSRFGRTRVALRSWSIRSTLRGWKGIRFCFDSRLLASGLEPKTRRGRQPFPPP